MAPKPGTTAPATKFQIIKNVPLPQLRVGSARGGDDGYPWADLEVGDHFVVPADVPSTITDPAERASAMKDAIRKLSSKLSGRIRTQKKQNPDRDYAARTVENGVGIWRVEPKAPAPAPVPPAPPVS
jgi:hypothetical protein